MLFEFLLWPVCVLLLNLFFCALSYCCTKSFRFYSESSSSYSPEVVRSSILNTDSLLLDVVCSSVSQGRSRQRDSVSTCLAGTSWCRTLWFLHRTQLHIELSLFFLLTPSIICLRLRHVAVTAVDVKDLRVLYIYIYIYYWRCSSSVTSWLELLSNGRSASSSQSGLCRLELKTISIMTLTNFVTVSEYLRWSCHNHDEFLQCQTHNCLSRDFILASLLEIILLISIWSHVVIFFTLSFPLRVVSSSHAFRHRCTPYRTSIYFVSWIALNFPISSFRACWFDALEEFHNFIQRKSFDTSSRYQRERVPVWAPDRLSARTDVVVRSRLLRASLASLLLIFVVV